MLLLIFVYLAQLGLSGLANQNEALREENADLMHQIEQTVGGEEAVSFVGRGSPARGWAWAKKERERQRAKMLKRCEPAMKREVRQCNEWETATKVYGFDHCCKKPDQHPNTCFEKQFNQACSYSEVVNIGDNGERYSVASQSECSRICEASPDCVAFTYVHYGVYSGGPNAEGTGACFYKGGTSTGTPQDTKKSCYVKQPEYCNEANLALKSEQALSVALTEEVKTGSGAAACYKKIVNRMCTYTVGSLAIDNGNSYSVTDEATCKQICGASSECTAFQYVHSGVQYSGGPTGAVGTGACYYMGGTAYADANDHHRTCYEKQDCDASAEITCDWKSGDGTGNGEEKISEDITGIACAKKCYKRGGFNGATVRSNGVKGCWCERSMNGIKSSSSYKTCYIRPKPDITCEWKTGDGTGLKEKKLDKDITGMACAIECHRLGLYNGATVLANGNMGCWCEEGMHGIKESSTTYKTCYINIKQESEQALSNPLSKESSSNALAESSLSQTTHSLDFVTYVFAAIGFLSMLYVGVKRGSKAFYRSDYAEV